MNASNEKKLALTIAFDGSNYYGWQVQPMHQPTLQETLSETISKLVKHPVQLASSGRTDAGVHANGMVAHFVTTTQIPVERLPRVLNSRLPQSIRIRDCVVVDSNFHARTSAIRKHYCYRVCTDPIATPLIDRFSWHFSDPVGWKKVEIALQALVGRHDFASFQASGSSVKTTTRSIQRAQLLPMNILGCQGYEIHLEGDGFLRYMVRNIVGTVIDIGQGYLGDIGSILAACNRAEAGQTAPARGLCLEQVFYR